MYILRLCFCRPYYMRTPSKKKKGRSSGSDKLSAFYKLPANLRAPQRPQPQPQQLQNEDSQNQNEDLQPQNEDLQPQNEDLQPQNEDPQNEAPQQQPPYSQQEEQQSNPPHLHQEPMPPDPQQEVQHPNEDDDSVSGDSTSSLFFYPEDGRNMKTDEQHLVKLEEAADVEAAVVRYTVKRTTVKGIEEVYSADEIITATSNSQSLVSERFLEIETILNSFDVLHSCLLMGSPLNLNDSFSGPPTNANVNIFKIMCRTLRINNTIPYDNLNRGEEIMVVERLSKVLVIVFQHVDVCKYSLLRGDVAIFIHYTTTVDTTWVIKLNVLIIFYQLIKINSFNSLFMVESAMAPLHFGDFISYGFQTISAYITTDRNNHVLPIEFGEEKKSFLEYLLLYPQVIDGVITNTRNNDNYGFKIASEIKQTGLFKRLAHKARKEQN